MTDSADAVRRVLGFADVVGNERQVSTDQANRSVAVDERFLVKWFREPVHRSDLDVHERLSRQGFRHMPPYCGAVEEDGLVVAIVSAFVPGATDGWQWYVDDVLAWIDGDLPLESLIDTGARMGRITAELHAALADHQSVIGPLDALRVQIAERRATALQQTAGPEGERLRARSNQIDDALAVLDDLDRVPVQLIHGDLHAGQFLRADGRLLLTDFDGDPMTAAGRRIDLQPVERDVASLLQSIDHVGRVAARRRNDAPVADFIAAATEAATQSYRCDHAVDDRLLLALRVAQELHEFAYAATRLSAWTYVPDAALTALFPLPDPASHP